MSLALSSGSQSVDRDVDVVVVATVVALLEMDERGSKNPGIPEDMTESWGLLAA